MLVPLMWCFARRLTHKRGAGAMAGALIAAGFMRFSQSRIATIDIYGTFFILLGAYFMAVSYTHLDVYKRQLQGCRTSHRLFRAAG